MSEPTQCSIEGCGGKALYKVRFDGYCKNHRQAAVDRRKKFQRWMAQFENDAEQQRNDIEAYRKTKDRKRQTRYGHGNGRGTDGPTRSGGPWRRF